jgi:hypothetical protein
LIEVNLKYEWMIHFARSRSGLLTQWSVRAHDISSKFKSILEKCLQVRARHDLKLTAQLPILLAQVILNLICSLWPTRKVVRTFQVNEQNLANFGCRQVIASGRLTNGAFHVHRHLGHIMAGCGSDDGEM